MYVNPGVTRSWEARHPQFMKPRDAVISFHCFSPNLVQVSERINSESIYGQIVQRHPDVVAKMETKYMFFADEAATARKRLNSGRSCSFSVYFREP
jgi:hypothetical protein